MSSYACHSFSTLQGHGGRKTRRRTGTTRERRDLPPPATDPKFWNFVLTINNALNTFNYPQSECLNESRRKKCDKLYPICGHCRRLNFICKQEEPRRIVPESTQDCGTRPHIGPAQSVQIFRQDSISRLPNPWSRHPSVIWLMAGRVKIRGQFHPYFFCYLNKRSRVFMSTSQSSISSSMKCVSFKKFRSTTLRWRWVTH